MGQKEVISSLIHPKGHNRVSCNKRELSRRNAQPMYIVKVLRDMGPSDDKDPKGYRKAGEQRDA